MSTNSLRNNTRDETNRVVRSFLSLAMIRGRIGFYLNSRVLLSRALSRDRLPEEMFITNIIKNWTRYIGFLAF